MLIHELDICAGNHGSAFGCLPDIFEAPSFQDVFQRTDILPDHRKARSRAQNDFLTVFQPFQYLSEFGFLCFGIMGTGGVAASAQNAVIGFNSGLIVQISHRVGRAGPHAAQTVMAMRVNQSDIFRFHNCFLLAIVLR